MVFPSCKGGVARRPLRRDDPGAAATPPAAGPRATVTWPHWSHNRPHGACFSWPGCGPGRSAAAAGCVHLAAASGGASAAASAVGPAAAFAGRAAAAVARRHRALCVAAEPGPTRPRNPARRADRRGRLSGLGPDLASLGRAAVAGTLPRRGPSPASNRCRRRAGRGLRDATAFALERALPVPGQLRAAATRRRSLRPHMPHSNRPRRPREH